MDKQTEECQGCWFKTDELKWYKSGRMPQDDTVGHWLCKLCAGTITGNVLDYPAQYSESTDVLRTICYVGNAVLQAVASIKVKEQVES